VEGAEDHVRGEEGAAVKEFPIFVPHRGGHLAALVTLPELDPRGLVLMLPGASLDEEVGSYLLFPRAASRLSELGFATVRMDYFGLGESTQDTEAWPLGLIQPALAQAEAVLATAKRAIGAERFAVLALCYGGRVALSLTARSDCVGALCAGPPLIEHGRWTRLRRRYGRTRLISAIKANRRLRRVILRPLRQAFSERKPTALVHNALHDLGHARILVLYGEGDLSRNYLRMQATRRLQALGTSLGERDRGRLAVEVTPTEPMAGFDLMPQADQQFILDRVVSWLAECFEVCEPAPSRTPRPEAVSTELVR
jgi:pimeloyl-ACP methyl ester carboxylesterase